MRTIQDIRRAHEAIGQHFFDPAAMRFFASRIHRTVHEGPGGTFFVTSERFIPVYGAGGYPRLFTVRRANADGTLNEYSEFQAFRDRHTAHMHAAAAARGAHEAEGGKVEA